MWAWARSSPRSVCLHLSKLLLGVLYAQVDCVSLCICVLVSHRCVSLLVRVWALGAWGEMVTSKIFNPPFPVLKAGHSGSYSYIHVCDGVNEVGFFLKIPVLCTFSCQVHVKFMSGWDTLPWVVLHVWFDPASWAASVAQLVEHLPRTQNVVGSRPTWGSSFFFENDCLGWVVFVLCCIALGVSWSEYFMYVGYLSTLKSCRTPQ